MPKKKQTKKKPIKKKIKPKSKKTNLPSPVMGPLCQYYYKLETVSEMFSIEPAIIEKYETIGLISSKIICREKGQEIIGYTENEVETIRKIKLLTEEMEVNLPGVEIILNLLKRLEE